MKHLCLTLLLCAPLTALADDATVVDAKASRSGGGWSFDVTLAHPDTGWDHYADGWRIEDAAGNVLGTRVLHHPHVNEQPFTRSLGGVTVPDGIDQVFVRTRCVVDGWADGTTALRLK